MAHQKIPDATPRAEWVIVTPELANKWLDETNSQNRNIREAHVARLAADMLDGKWRGRNGEAIRFDKNGRLVDGQHRLYACITANVAFESLVVWDVSPDVYATIGIGAKKSFADFLGPVDREKNTNLLSSVLRLVTMWDEGHLDKMREGGKFTPSIAKMQETLAEQPTIRDSVHWVMNHKETRKLLTPSIACLIHYAGAKEGKKARVETFLERLGDGLAMAQDDPAYQLRRFLLQQRSPKPGLRRAAQPYVLALAIKAWKVYEANKKLSVLKFTANEEFPKL